MSISTLCANRLTHVSVFEAGVVSILTCSTRSRTREGVLSKGDEDIFLFFEAEASDAPAAPRFSAGISLSSAVCWGCCSGGHGGSRGDSGTGSYPSFVEVLQVPP